MPPIHVRCECGKTFDVPDSRAGQRFKCTGCGASLRVPGAAGEAEAEARAEAKSEAKEPPAAPTPAKPARAGAAARSEPRAGRASARGAAKPSSGSRMPLVLGGVALVAALGVGGFFAFKKGDDPSPAPNGGPAPVVVAEPPKPEPAKDPVAEKRAEFEKRLAAAEKAADVPAALRSVAAFCREEPKLEEQALAVWQKLLLAAPEDVEAREALGFRRYEGDQEEHRGQWVAKARFDELVAADAAAKAEREKWEKDPFLKAARGRIREMEAMIASTNAAAKDLASALPPDTKEKEVPDPDETLPADAEPATFRFFVDVPDVPRPYVLAVQDVGVPRPESWAAAVGPILRAIHDSFYGRYGHYVKLRSLVETPVPVWLFSSKGQYDRWRRSGNGGPPSSHVRAFYTGTMQKNASGFLYLWLRDPREEKTFTEDPIEELKGVIWHEATHQLMDFNSPGRGFSDSNSPWMQEGFAEYVGGYSTRWDKDKKGWQYFFGIPQIERRNAVMGFGLQAWTGSEEAKLEMNPTIREIATLTYPEFWLARAQTETKQPGPEAERAGRIVSGAYAIGWVLCHFLQHGEDGKYRDGFHRWLQSELERHPAGGPGDVFEEIFGLGTEEAWNQFEFEVQAYVAERLGSDARKVHRKDDSVFEKYRKDFEEAVAKGKGN